MIQKKKKYKLVDFDYPLPPKFIAQYPSQRRDLAKMMVVHRDTGKLSIKNSQTCQIISERMICLS